ncbi:hypothetical protein K491DRAFT_689715 [Lophiostoma macrostomum CBS 122681]|uniref:Uncharacterized protein n=1 Tax=Lophiostoma macrostomum CBS 122681 TaxID=1314788 RepID=A0A6A6TG46_9PLEO|nr:hypothetical protein K491DRAFT_689715 [Lophiostoma macrostomum CBS 122681]
MESMGEHTVLRPAAHGSNTKAEIKDISLLGTRVFNDRGMTNRPDPNAVFHPLEVARRAAQVGGAAAIPGTIIGSLYGTIRTSTPLLFSVISGLQWFAIGSTYWTIRTSILNRDGLSNYFRYTRGIPLRARTDQHPTKSEKVTASSVSGSVTGAVLGLVFRGPKNVIPGTIMFGLCGFGGQHLYEYLDSRNTRAVRRQMEIQERVESGVKEEVKDNWVQRAAKSKWSPMSVLTDEQYEEMMKEKILSVEVQIALIDDRIEGMRVKQRELEKSQAEEQVQERNAEVKR